MKIIAALCKQNGGQIRIKGELVDVIDQPVTLLKEWDSQTQELVLSTHMGTFAEVYRAIPEKQPTKEVIAADPLREKTPEPAPMPNKRASTLDDEKLKGIETTLTKRRVAAMLADEMRRRNAQQDT